MAQTPRSFDDLVTLFADNAARKVDAVQLRDFLVSALGCYGSLQITGGSTALGLTATPAAVTSWLLAPAALNSSVTPNLPAGELRLNSDGIWRAEFSASFLVSAAPDRFLWQLRLDAVVIAGGQRDVDGALAAREPVQVAVPFSAVAGQKLTVYAAAIGAAGDAALEHANLNVHRVG